MRHIPNLLTVLRLLLTPVWWVVFYQALFQPSTSNSIQALLMLAFLSFTDFADGKLAKARDGRWKSNWGAVWDPIADKALFLSSMLLVCAWMLSNTGGSPTAARLLVSIACASITPILAMKHLSLDYASTQLRNVQQDSAKTLGRLKFVMDLLTLALALLGAWSLERDAQNIVIVYLMVTCSLAIAVGLARINVNNRRAALQATTS